MKSILIISPHPDDAILGCGGTIIKETRNKKQVYIVYLTDGRACYEVTGIKSELTLEQIAEKRKKEAIDSSRKLGVPIKNLFFFEIWDQKLKEPKNFSKALLELKKLLHKIKPFRIFGPVFKNRHPDHQATHDIILEALKEFPDIEFYMYGLQKSIGKSDLKIDISDVREQKAEAMFLHEIEQAYEKEIYEILALQKKERFRCPRRKALPKDHRSRI